MTDRTVPLAVVGAHLDGQPLNGELTSRGGTLLERTCTAASYLLFALDTTPPKPGLVRVNPDDRDARAIEVEIWELAVDQFGDFVAQVPAPLGIGRVQLSDGTEVAGFICETVALDGARDITPFGGWRAYLDRPHPSCA